MSLRNRFAVSRNLPCSTATLITHSEVEACYASDPLPNFQIDRAHDTRESAAFHRLMPSHRILYAGDDSALSASLRDGLKGLDCFVVRSPAETARLFIKSDIKYSLLLFDDTAAGVELKDFARTLVHRKHVPTIIIKESSESGELLGLIRRRLSLSRAP